MYVVRVGKANSAVGQMTLPADVSSYTRLAISSQYLTMQERYALTMKRFVMSVSVCTA